MSGNPIEDSELRILMKRYQDGDADAVDELVGRVSPVLLRYFGALQGSGRTDREGAEDLLQECWIRVHRSRHTYRVSEPVMPWIYAIARHTRLDGYRKRRRRESREMLVETLPESAARQTPDHSLEQPRIEQLIAALPESQRE